MERDPHPYSTLEVHHQHDSATTAPEHDNTASNPEVAPSTDPQLFYDGTLPEAVPKHEAPHLETGGATTRSPEPRRSRRKVVICAIVASIILLAIALGVGLGVGLSRKSSPTASTAASSAAPSPTVTSNPQISATAPPGAAPGAALDDTSVAVAITSDGTRHVFFQDQTNTIRQAIYETSSGTWSATTNLIVATDAKALSPLSAFEVPEDLAGQEEVHLLYVTSNNTVNAKIFNLNTTSWINQTATYGNITQFQVATGSRSLAATRRQNYTSNRLQESLGLASGLGQQYPILTSQNFTMYLLFEDVSGNVQWYFGWWGFSTTATLEKGWQWRWTNLDISSYANDALLNQVNGGASSVLSPPFSVGIAPSSGGGGAETVSDPTFAVKVFAVETHNGGANYTFFDQTFNDTSQTNEVTGFGLTGIPNATAVDFTQGCISNGLTNDAHPYAFYVNGTSLAAISGLGDLLFLSTQPDSPFPYKRLGSLSPANSTQILLYHQLNNSAFIEDMYDTTDGVWTSSNFTISTS